MASFRQVKTAVGDFPGSPFDLAATFDSAPLEGSLLIAMAWGGTTVDVVPSGFSTAVSAEDGPGFMNRYIYYKIAGASEGSTITVSFGADEEYGLIIYEFAGGFAASPLDKTATQQTTSGSVETYNTGSTGTLAQADEIAVAFGGLWDGNDKTFSWDSGFTKSGDIFNGSSNNMVGGYKITAATTALDPFFSWTTAATSKVGAIATFKIEEDQDHVSTDSGALGEAAAATVDHARSDLGSSLGEAAVQAAFIPKVGTDLGTLGETVTELLEEQLGFPEVAMQVGFGWEWNATPLPYVDMSVDTSYLLGPNGSYETFGNAFMFKGVIRLDDWDWPLSEEATIVDNMEVGVGGWKVAITTAGLLKLYWVDSGGTTRSVTSDVPIDTKDVTQLPNTRHLNRDIEVYIFHVFTTHSVYLAGWTSFYAGPVGSDTAAIGLGDLQTGNNSNKPAATSVDVVVGASRIASAELVGRIYTIEVGEDFGVYGIFEFDAADAVAAKETFDGYKTTAAVNDNLGGAGAGFVVKSDTVDVVRDWTDVTSFVKSQITAKRGRQHELGRIETGTMNFTLRSSDDRFNPDNTSSPYWPHVRPMAHVRFRAEDPGPMVWYNLWTGYIRGWPQQWTHYGKQSRVPIKCIDALGIMSRTSVRDWVASILDDSPLAFWRCGDPDDLNTWLDESGHSTNHDVDWDTGSPGSTASFFPIAWADRYSIFDDSAYLQPTSGEADFRLTGDLTVEIWLNPDDTSTVDRIVSCQDSGPGTSGYFLSAPIVTPGGVGHRRMTWYQMSASGIFDRIAPGPDIPNDVWTHLVVVRKDGIISWYVNGEPAEPSTGGSLNVGDAPAYNGTETFLIGGAQPSTANYLGKMSELAIYDKALTAGSIKKHYNAAISYAQVVSGIGYQTMLLSVFDQVGWNPFLPDGPGGFYYPNVTNPTEYITAVVLDDTALKIMRKGDESFESLTFANRHGQIEMHQRHYRATQKSAAVYTFGETDPDYSYRDLRLPSDDSLVRNIWQVTPVDQATQEATDQDSIDTFGPRTEAIKDAYIGKRFATSDQDDQAYQRAAAGLAKTKDDETRVERISITGQSNASLWLPIMSYDLSDRVTIKRTPPGGSSTTRDAYIEHVEHRVTVSKQWLTHWRLSPADKFSEWVLGDSVMGKLGETTRLAWGE